VKFPLQRWFYSLCWGFLPVFALAFLVTYGTADGWLTYPATPGAAGQAGQGLTISFTQLDLSSYAFGLVAVTVTGAGILLSLIAEPMPALILRTVESQLVPNPFSSVEHINSVFLECERMPADQDKMLWQQQFVALKTLMREASGDWSRRFVVTRAKLSDAVVVIEAPKGFVLCLFGTDRLIVYGQMILVTLAYLAVPLFFVAKAPPSVLWFMLILVYGLSIVSLLTSALLFALRVRCVFCARKVARTVAVDYKGSALKEAQKVTAG
jgi:hypothetical protein